MWSFRAGLRIGPEDGLSINVWKEAELTATLPVRPDGKISLPLLGDVQAAGLTPKELGDSVTEKLKKFVADPALRSWLRRLTASGSTWSGK